MPTNHLIFSVFLVLFLNCMLQAQDRHNIEHLIQSEAFNKERKIRVFLPERYFRDTSTSFLVTYVLDAHSDQLWNMTKGNIGYLVSMYSVIPMIVVGINSDNRGSEFRPPSTELSAHLKNEVFPLIEQNYRVNSFRTIIGHSWGGAFVGNTLFSDARDMFDAYIGISPSFDYADDLILNNADSMLSAPTSFKKFFYASAGNVGMREIEAGRDVGVMDSIISEHPNVGLSWMAKPYPGYDHWHVVVPSINDGLIAMSRNYFVDQKLMEDFVFNTDVDLRSQIENYYEEKQKNFGYTFRASAPYYKFVGDDFRDTGDFENAIVVYKMALELDPENVRAFVNLADTYHKMNEKELAIVALKRSQELLEKQKESLSEGFYRDISKWVVDKLDGYK